MLLRKYSSKKAPKLRQQAGKTRQFALQITRLVSRVNVFSVVSAREPEPSAANLAPAAARIGGDFYEETAIGIGVSSAAENPARRLSKRFVCCCLERRSK